MIHPINIPEDLMSANPKRPQFFRSRPKIRISYGSDGRRLGPDGSAVEPISPNTYWNDVFMRTFIRRLVPVTPNDLGVAASNGANSAPAHVDIVDLSPSASNSSLQEGTVEGTAQQGGQSAEANEEEADEEDEADENSRKSSSISTASSTASTLPDRPASSSSSADEEEADGDVLAKMCSGECTKLDMPARAKPQRISRKAIQTVLRECCARRKEEANAVAMEEFARLDFSLLNLCHGTEKEETTNGNALDDLELVPERRGCRLWTAKRGGERQQRQVHFDEEKKCSEMPTTPPHLRFSIAAVRIKRGAAKRTVAISMEAHNSMAKPLDFEIETHVHRVNGQQQIGQCVHFQKQVERLNAADAETAILVEIQMDEGMLCKRVIEHAGTNDEAANGEFLMATMHGRVLLNP